MKIVFRTGDYPDFLIFRSLLAQAGLHVHSGNAESYTAMSTLGPTDGYHLWVPDDEFEDAVKLLSDTNAGGGDVFVGA